MFIRKINIESRINLIFIEPGYYEENKYGIRLETDIEVVKAFTKVSIYY